MWSRVLRRLLLSSAIVALFLCIAPRLAHAQATITIYQENSLPRVNADGSDRTKRPLNLTPEGVNNQDCVDDARIRFPLQLANFVGGGTLEAWAGLSGESCSSNTSRTSANRVCWNLLTGIPLTLNQNVEIPVRTIMSGVKGATSPNASASICGTVDLTTVSVNFLYFAPGQTNEASTTKTVSVQIDTIGPAAPTGLRALPGNTRLVMNWDNISGEGGVSVLTSVQVFCDENHTGEIPDVSECKDLIAERRANPLTASDAGTTKDAGTSADAGADVDSGTTAAILEDGGCIDELDDAGNTIVTCDSGAAVSVDGSTAGSGGACESTNLAPSTGSFAPTTAYKKCFSCGTVTGNTGTSVTASSLRGKPLTNNTVYAIAVAATDAFDNVGPLSAIQCEYPEVTNDFWQDYKNAGGNAGGGCAVSSETPVGTIVVLGSSMAVLIVTLRRRRKK